MAVPDTNTFSLLDVVNEIKPSSNDLVTCFAEADINKFDPAYYDTGNDLLEFRNYEASQYVLTADQTDLHYTADVGSKIVYITIQPDAVPEVSIIGSFISTNYSAEFDVLTVTVSRNTTGYGRLGSVLLTHPQDSNTTETINVTQDS